MMSKFKILFFCLASLSYLFFSNVLLAQVHPQFAKRFNYYKPKQYSLFVKGDIGKIKNEVKKIGGTFKSAFGNIASIIIPANKYEEFMNADWYESRQLDYYHGLTMDDQSNINNNVSLVHNGTLPLTQGYDGTGVIVGFLDSGLDINHPDFKLSNGHSRIKYLWDQADTAGYVHPLPYGYGKDWDSTKINNGTCTHSPPLNFYGHGTLTTGVACGNSQQHCSYRAIAPNADIIFVAIDFAGITGNSFESCVADGAAYIFAKAAALGKPCVINASLGTYSGSHDGTDLATQAIENLLTAQSGRVFVAAAGNAGSKPIHLGYNIPANDSAYTFFNTFTTGGLHVMYFELFSDYANWNNAQFAVGTDYTNPFTHLPRTKFLNVLADYQMSSQTTFTRYDTIKNINGQRLGIMESYCEKQNGHYFMYFGVIADSVTNYVWRFMTKGSGKLDVWSHPNYTGTSAMLYNGLPSIAQLPDIVKYILPDTEQTIVGEWNCSPKIISVANYLNRTNYNTWQGNNYVCETHQQGSRFYSSSKGPTRTGAQKPDITASGEWTMAANDLFWLNWAKTNNPNSLLSDTLHGPHKGTSAAAPAVSGVVALYLQKYPNANWADVKASITTCVKTDNFTGTNLPDYNWGYGKIDAFKVLNCKGCTNSSSNNYNPYSQINDGSCLVGYPVLPTIIFRQGVICAGDTISIKDSTTFSTLNWYWNFGGGSIPITSLLPNPIVKFITPGKHAIALIVSNAGGSATVLDTINVEAKPTSSFAVISSVCVGNNDVISYTGNATTTANYTWTFNSAITTGVGQGPYTANWTTTGSKIVSLQVAENGCLSDITSQNVTVQALPIANFTAHILGGNVTFVNSSSSANYYWSFGDGGSSTQTNPTHIYSTNGTYIVTLTVDNGLCAASDSIHINITTITGVETVLALPKEILLCNKTSNNLQVVLKNFIQPQKAELINTLGQTVLLQTDCKDNNSFFFNTAHLAAAIYFIRCTDIDGKEMTTKWMKQKQ